MGSSQSLSRRIVTVVKLALTALVAIAGISVAIALPASAASAPTIANGFAGYSPGTTSPPNQFDALTLVSGGAASVNTASLTIVTQPASGTATVTASSTHGIISYTPASGTTGTQTLTFAYCAPGDTYPSAGNCTTATMTYGVASGQYMGGDAGGLAGVIDQVQIAVSLPSTVVQGSTVSMSSAPVATAVPSSDDGITVNYAEQFSAIIPVPKGLTYVPGSIGVTGGDATSSGNYKATYCTAPVANACTAQIDTGNYKTIYPYIETFLNTSTTIAGGQNVTLPTVTAQFTATGTVNTVAPIDLTEFVLTTNVQIVGAVTFDAYPSCASCANGDNPNYAAPTPLASTTITSGAANVVAVTGISPATGPPPGGTSVTITGTDFSNATAVDFGSTPATNFTIGSSTSITATAPAGTGTVDVTVTAPDGTSATSSADQYTYTVVIPPPTLTSITPNSGLVTGGTNVTITGTNLQNATAVNFGQSPGTIVSDSSTQITAVSPPGSGTVDVTVTTPSGTSAPIVADQYSFGAQATSQIGTWADAQGCGTQSTTTVPNGASSVVISTSGGTGGGGGGAASSDSGGSGGSASTVSGSFPVSAGQQLTAVTGCGGATAPHGSGVVSTGGAGGIGYSNGGSGGNGNYCAGIAISGACIGTGGPDGSGGGGGGSTAVCVAPNCQVGTTPLIVAAGGGGGGESMCAGSDGGSGGTGGGGSSTSSVDLTGAGNSGTGGGSGATSGDVGGTGGVNSSGNTPGGTNGGPGSTNVSLGDSAGNGGGGGGYVGGTGSTSTAGVDCGAGGGGGAGASWAVNGSGASFGTTSAPAAVALTYFGFVGTGPTVTTQPTATTANAGQTASFTAAASGNPSPDVQWQVSTDGGVTFTNVNGATHNAYSFTTTAAETGNRYRAVFANSLGSVTTTAAPLTVDTLPTVTTQPSDAEVTQGSTASFTAAATGNPTPTVQWQVSVDGGVTFTNIAGATSPTYSFTTSAGESGNQYQAVFTNTVGSVASDAAGLTLDLAPVVTTQPTSVSVVTGQVASFTSAASGSPAPSEQWQLSTNGGVSFSDIAGATSATYSVGATVLSENGYQYRAVFTNSVTSATSNVATLTVTLPPPLTITTTSLPEGSVYSSASKDVYSATLAATGGNPPYKWSVLNGTLPTGLKLSSKGVIKGKAAIAGTFTFTVQVVDHKLKTKPVPPVNTATKQLSITIG